jgi:hypothetical protein
MIDEDGPGALLVGKQLTAVEFVMDHVRLQFEGEATLSADTHPVVRKGDAQTLWGEPGFRDMICDCIGKTVRAWRLVEGLEACIDFEHSTSVCVSLRPDDYVTAEALMLQSRSGRWWVW